VISVLVVDDLPAVRQGLRLRLGLETDVRVVGEAADGRVALKQATELEPDVIVMDLAMPVMDGFAAAATLRKVAPQSRIVVLTLCDDVQTRTRAAEAGAAALIAKYEPAERLIEAIREVVKQGVISNETFVAVQRAGF
jgi:DNA-binding NarL/FixJ family response regulator